MKPLNTIILGYGIPTEINWNLIDYNIVRALDKIYYYVRGVMSHINDIRNALWLQ